MQYMKKNRTTLLLVGILLLGLGLIAYPSFSNYWNSFHQVRAIASYADRVSDLDEADYSRILKEARDFNEKLAESGIRWELKGDMKKAYDKALDVFGSGVMGYIIIDRINCNLPVYHGTEESALQVAIGHLEGTSLPVGGTTSHCVLSGHRGLPSARLFTDLDQLELGDVFELHVLSETYSYVVDHILITEPDDVSALALEKGKEYCTLVTCTPYGINTHRLLIRGHRIDNDTSPKIAHVTADGLQIESVIIAPLVAIPILLFLLCWMMIESKNRKKGGKIKDEIRKNYFS